MNAKTPSKKTCIGLSVALLASVLAITPAGANTSSDDLTTGYDQDWCSASFDPNYQVADPTNNGYLGDSNSCDDDSAVMTMTNTGGYNGVVTNFAGCDATGDVCTLGFSGFMDGTLNIDPADTGRNAFGDDFPIAGTVTISVNPPAQYRVWVSTRDVTTGVATANTVVGGATSLLWNDVICIGNGVGINPPPLTIVADGATTESAPAATLPVTYVPAGTITSVVGARIVGDSLAGCPPTNLVPRTVTITPTYTYTDTTEASATAGLGTPVDNMDGTCTVTYSAGADTVDANNYGKAVAFWGLNGLIEDEVYSAGAGAQTASVAGTVTIATGDIIVAWASATQIGDRGQEALDTFVCASEPCNPADGDICACPAPFTGNLPDCVPPSVLPECFDGVDNDGDAMTGGGTDFTGSPADPNCTACPFGTESDSSVCNTPTPLPLPGCLDGSDNPDAHDEVGDANADLADSACDPAQGGFPLLNEDGTIPYTSLECIDSVDNDGDDTTGGGIDFDGFGSTTNSPDPNCDIFQGGNPLVREDGTA